MSHNRKTALVTGGRRGIGLGIARSLAAEGYDLVISGVSGDADEAVAELSALGARAIYCQADIADAAARLRLVEAVRQNFGRLDALVNNAGVAPAVRADILDASEESFERLIRTNVQGPYFLTQQVARWMIQQRQADAGWSGCIVNVSSISAAVASTNRGDYCMSKAALGMATALWAARLGEWGIGVYEIRPGIIETDMTAGVKDKYDKLITQGLLIQPRWGRPDDVGRVVAMLARGDLGYSTGQVIYTDGGFHVRRL